MATVTVKPASAGGLVLGLAITLLSVYAIAYVAGKAWKKA